MTAFADLHFRYRRRQGPFFYNNPDFFQALFRRFSCSFRPLPPPSDSCPLCFHLFPPLIRLFRVQLYYRPPFSPLLFICLVPPFFSSVSLILIVPHRVFPALPSSSAASVGLGTLAAIFDAPLPPMPRCPSSSAARVSNSVTSGAKAIAARCLRPLSL